MSKIQKLALYILLGSTFILTVLFMGNLCFKQKQQEEDFAHWIETVQKEEKETLVKEQEDLLVQQKNEQIVLVKKLPLYASNQISENKEAEPKIELLRGERVLVEEEGTPYSLVKNAKGTILGYVWSDCLGEKEKLSSSKVIVIDAGHQEQGMREKEPIGPGAEVTKAKVSSGTAGISTEIEEHKTVLNIALRLEKELEARGYVVVQVRREADVSISNSERAVLANQIEADVLIRLHGNGAENHAINGADTYYISKNNPYVKNDIYDECKLLAECVLDAYTEANPEIKKNKTHESDEYTGLNWCEVPSVILEMGYLTNKSDDEYINNSRNILNIVNGIANGIDNYFDNMDEK